MKPLPQNPARTSTRYESYIYSRSPDSVLNSLSRARRLRNMNSTGRDRSSELTTISSKPSSRSGIRIRYSLCTKGSDQTSGMQTSSADFESLRTTETAQAALVRNWGAGRVLFYDVSGHLIHQFEYTDLALSCVSTYLMRQIQPEPSDGTCSWQRGRSICNMAS